MTDPFYGPTLAQIHDMAFGQVARAGARALHAAIKQHQKHDGCIVDLGCGSGITLAHFATAGYETYGVDISEDFIALARQRLPQGQWHTGSYEDAKWPRAIAVSAFGEVLSYTSSAEVADEVIPQRQRLFQRIYDRLLPGGVFIFDICTPQRAPTSSPHRYFGEDEEGQWLIAIEARHDARCQQLIRHISTFVLGENGSVQRYQRHNETHRQLLFSPDAIEDALRTCGFRVERLNAYGTTPMLPGVVGFIATK